MGRRRQQISFTDKSHTNGKTNTEETPKNMSFANRSENQCQHNKKKSKVNMAKDQWSFAGNKMK